MSCARNFCVEKKTTKIMTAAELCLVVWAIRQYNSVWRLFIGNKTIWICIAVNARGLNGVGVKSDQTKASRKKLPDILEIPAYRAQD